MKTWAVVASLLLAGFPHAAWAAIGRVNLVVPKAGAGTGALGVAGASYRPLVGRVAAAPTTFAGAGSLVQGGQIPQLPSTIYQARAVTADVASAPGLMSRAPLASGIADVAADAPRVDADALDAAESADAPAIVAGVESSPTDIDGGRETSAVDSARGGLPSGLRRIVDTVLSGWTSRTLGAERPADGRLADVSRGETAPSRVVTELLPYAARAQTAELLPVSAASPAAPVAAAASPVTRLKTAAVAALRGVSRVWRRPTADPMDVRLESASVAREPELAKAVDDALDGALAPLGTARAARELDAAGREMLLIAHRAAFDALAGEARGQGVRARAALVAAHVLARPRSVPFEELRYAFGPQTARRLLEAATSAKIVGRKTGRHPLERLHVVAGRKLDKAGRRELLGVPPGGAPFRLTWALAGKVFFFMPGKLFFAVYLAALLVPGVSPEALISAAMALKDMVLAAVPAWVWVALAGAAAGALASYWHREYGEPTINTDETQVP